MLTPLRARAVMLWAVLPVLAALQALTPSLQPTCAAGFSDVSLALASALLIVHHGIMESQAWVSARSLATGPELIVLRTYGVLRKRRWLVLVGLLEDLSLYNDLTFPLLAFECRAELSERWAASWARLPILGHLAVLALRALRFWGACGLCAAAVLAAALPGLCRLLAATPSDFVQYTAPTTTPASDLLEEQRLTGESFVALARHAEAAGMPSVAHLCGELALQRRWVFDAKEDLGGARGAARARESVVFGKAPSEVLAKHELRDEEMRARVDTAGAAHAFATLVGKLLLGSVVQLWLQVSFFELAYNSLGAEARIKLAARIALSVLHLAARLKATPFRLGAPALALASLACALTGWAVLKVFYGFTCPSHVWEVPQGCVEVAPAPAA